MRISDWSSDVCSSDLGRVAIAFAGLERDAPAPVEVEHAHDQDEHAAQGAQPRRGPGIGAEERGRDDVLDLRRARQRVHGEGEGAQRDGARDQALGDVALAEQLRGERIHRERSEEHTSELPSLMRISYAVFCLKKKNNNKAINTADGS